MTRFFLISDPYKFLTGIETWNDMAVDPSVEIYNNNKRQVGLLKDVKS